MSNQLDVQNERGGGGVEGRKTLESFVPTLTARGYFFTGPYRSSLTTYSSKLKFAYLVRVWTAKFGYVMM